MPFDGSTVIPCRSVLDRVSADLGITGISEAVLEAHKRAEIARYPAGGGFFYRHRQIMALTAVVLVLMGFANVVRMGVTGMARWDWLCLGLMLPVFLLQFIKLRGPVHWVETYLSTSALKPVGRKPIVGMPEPIVALAQRVVSELGRDERRCVFTVGELRQDTIVLDPYLIVRDVITNERLILGIWINDTVLHIAQ